MEQANAESSTTNQIKGNLPQLDNFLHSLAELKEGENGSRCHRFVTLMFNFETTLI